MKQRRIGKSKRYKNTLFSCFTEKELYVADILLDLPNLFAESDSRRRYPLTWSSKRRRSAINISPSSPRFQRNSPDHSEIERRPKVKAHAPSPSTPLSFSPSESDEKSKHSLKRISKKRTREELLEIIDGLTKRRELLRGEVEIVRSYYNKLKAFNLELRAKKQELSSCLVKENPHMEMSKSLNLGVKLKHYQSSMLAHQPPFIMDQTAYKSQTSGKFQYPLLGQMAQLLSSNSLLGMVNQMGPLGIPDLNVHAKETSGVDSYQPLDLNRVLADNRVKAAEARRRRMIKIKEVKNSLAATKLQRFR